MARFLIPIVCFTVFSLGSCAIPSNWNELLGSDAPLFPETILSASNGPVLHSRVLRELSAMLADTEISSKIYAKYLDEYEKPETRKYINVFKSNLMLIAKRNLLFHTGKSTWEEGINKFTDMPDEELGQYYGGLPTDPEPPTADELVSNLTLAQAPDSLDWREKNAVGPVKDQGSCGSCWSFSANVAVEGAIAKKSNESVTPLSEQELVDCHRKSCSGEWPWKALDYISDNGISTEADYPYTSSRGRVGTCDAKSNKAAKGLAYVRSKKESDYRSLTATNGPFSGSLYYHKDMTRQKSGVYDGACGKDLLGRPSGHHAIGVVGYGEENGVKYWIIKNSYGAGFADKGYVKLRADVDKCGFESYIGATFVTSA